MRNENHALAGEERHHHQLQYGSTANSRCTQGIPRASLSAIRISASHSWVARPGRSKLEKSGAQHAAMRISTCTKGGYANEGRHVQQSG